MDTKKYRKILSILNDILIEIRALEDERLPDSRLIANVLHKFPDYLKDWNDTRYEEVISDLRKRIRHRPETKYLEDFLKE